MYVSKFFEDVSRVTTTKWTLANDPINYISVYKWSRASGYFVRVISLSSLLERGKRRRGERRGMVEPWPARRDRFCTRHEECNLPGFSPLPPPPTSPSPPPRTTIFHPLDRQLLPLPLRRRQRRRSLSTDSELLRNKILTIDDARSSARIRFNVRLSFFSPPFLQQAEREFVLFYFALSYFISPLLSFF